jgi:hypothetical protein
LEKNATQHPEPTIVWEQIIFLMFFGFGFYEFGIRFPGKKRGVN